MLKFILYLLAIFSPIVARPQCIRGDITDSLSCPLPFATISLIQLHKVTTADKNGMFVLKNIPVGTYTLNISHISHQSKNINITIKDSVTYMKASLPEREIMLEEVSIYPVDFIKFILDKLSSNKSLKKIKNTHSAIAQCRIESKGNLKEYPSELLFAFNTMMSLIGYRTIFGCMKQNPNLSVSIGYNVNIQNGKIKISNRNILESVPDISSKEKSAFLHKKWHVDQNLYDKMYSIAKRYAKKYNKLQHNKNDAFVYCGTFTENGETIHILKLENYEFHVVEGCWQIYRMIYEDLKSYYYIECDEIEPDLYLPITSHNEDRFDLDADKKWSLLETISYEYQDIN